MKNIFNIIKASSILIGTIIGVGVFGLPYVASQSSVLVVIAYLIILGAMITIIHYFYGEVVAISQKQERLVGYVGEFLGDKSKNIAKVTVVIGRIGALLAYIIVSGHFIEALFNLNNFYGSLVFFALGSLVIFWGLKALSWLEVIMSGFLLLAILSIFIFSFSSLNINNLSFDFSNIFLPYGVVLFSLAGASAIPEMAELLKNRKRQLRKAIIIGNIIPIILFIVFTVMVVGVTGVNTTQEALVGLQDALGAKAMIIGLLFGIIALFTSFITIGLNIKKIFWYDFKLNKILSFLIACGLPGLLFILGLRNFIDTIGLVGAIFGGINGIFIALIYKKAKKKFVLPVILMVIFGLGIIYEIYSGFAFAF